MHREGVLTICGFIVNAPGRGFGDGKGFYDLWLYSKCSAGLYTLLYQQIADSIYFLKSYFLKQKMAFFFSCLGG